MYIARHSTSKKFVLRSRTKFCYGFWLNAKSIFISYHTTEAENCLGLLVFVKHWNFMKWHSFKIKTEINTLFILHCLARKKTSRFLVYYLFQGLWMNLIIKNDGWYYWALHSNPLGTFCILHLLTFFQHNKVAKYLFL